MPRTRVLRTLVVASLAAITVACSGPDGDGAGPSPPSAQRPADVAPVDETSSEASPTEASAPAESPEPLTLRQVDGRTLRARPFADFAVAMGDGAWVTGVAPGAVRYDDRSRSVTARTRLSGSVGQAVEESVGTVWIPTDDPALLRVDATTGEVVWQVRLPEQPLPEGVVGAVGDTAYVLVDEASPTILVVARGRVVDRIAAPEFALGVRAGYGALWVPTGASTVERYDLDSGRWTTIPTGPGPRFLDLGFGAVWVMDQADGSVTRIDARTLEPEIIAGTDYVIQGGDLTTGGGAVWLRTDDSVLRIDPDSRAVTHVLGLPPGSGSVAATTRVLWITNHDHLAVHAVPLPLPD